MNYKKTKSQFSGIVQEYIKAADVNFNPTASLNIFSFKYFPACSYIKLYSRKVETKFPTIITVIFLILSHNYVVFAFVKNTTYILT